MNGPITGSEIFPKLSRNWKHKCPFCRSGYNEPTLTREGGLIVCRCPMCNDVLRRIDTRKVSK